MAKELIFFFPWTVFGIVEYCILIVCAFGIINSMNHFIKIKFNDLYFDYKLSLKGNE